MNVVGEKDGCEGDEEEFIRIRIKSSSRSSRSSGVTTLVI